MTKPSATLEQDIKAAFTQRGMRVMRYAYEHVDDRRTFTIELEPEHNLAPTYPYPPIALHKK